MRLGQMLLLLCLLILLPLAMATRASAGTVYDAAGDFSLASNPDGVWSYGTTGTTLTGPLMLFNSTENAIGLVPFLDGWVGNEAMYGDHFPLVAKNTSDSTQFSGFNVVVLPNQLTEAPGPDGANAIVRFTAPTSGLFRLNTTFSGAERLPTTSDVDVLLNGSTLFAAAIDGFGPISDQSFVTTLSLNAGDQIDFAVGVGSNGNFNGDLTGLAVTISSGAVPEPSAAVLAGLGILGLLGFRLTKRLMTRTTV